MASIRDLKKDINFLTDEVIGNCFLHYYFVEDNEQKKVDEIIEEMVKVRNDLINRVNNPAEDSNKKTDKDYYRSIRDELIEKANKAFDSLEKLQQKEKK